MTNESHRYPALKTGITLRAQSSSYLLGLPHGDQLVLTAEQAQMARAFDGWHTCAEISRGALIELPQVMKFVENVADSGFIDLLEQPAPSQSGGLQNFSEELSTIRLRSEISTLSHRRGARDGGAGEFRARANYSILISGESRLARHMLVALHASGFTATSLIPRTRAGAHLGSEDVCGLLVRPGDIGTSRKVFIDSVIKEAQIIQAQSQITARPNLIISTAPIEWDYVQRWMSEGSEHLHIHPVIGHEIEIGPLISPGEDPCLRCCILHKRDLGIDVSYEFIRTQAPTAAISFIAGLVALAIGEYVATGQSPFRAASYWYDLLDPLRPAEIRHWNFHSECGCHTH